MSFHSDIYMNLVNISQSDILDDFHLSFQPMPPHINFVEDKEKGVDYDSEMNSSTEPTDDAPAGAKLDVPSKAKENPSKPPKKKTRFSISQTQGLENLFQEDPLPKAIQRKKLSDEIGLNEDQVKYWFQNRRYQDRVSLEHNENKILRKEVEKLRAENKELKEAFDIALSNCGEGSLGSSSGHNLKIELRTLLPSGSASPFEGIYDAGLDGFLQSDEFRMPVPAENISLTPKNPFVEELS